MKGKIVRTQEEIESCILAAMIGEIEGSRWPGMSYEEGVVATIKWMTDRNEPNPMEDD